MEPTQNTAQMDALDSTQSADPQTAPNPNPGTNPPQVAQAPNSPAQPTQGGPVNNSAAGNPTAPQPPQQQPDHGSIYKDILGVLAGGRRRAVRDENGNPVYDKSTGQVKTEAMTTKQLGAGILAGALASMAASFQHLPERNGNGIMQSNQNASVQAGAQAGAEQTSQARLQQAQQVSDDTRMRQYQTASQNMQLHSQALAANHLSDEGLTNYQKIFEPIVTNLQNVTGPDGSPVIAGQRENEAALVKRIKESGGDVTRDSAIPDGVQPEIGPDGKPTGKLEQTWTSFHNGGKIAVTKDMIEQYNLTGVREGTEVPVAALVQRGLTSGGRVLADHIVDSLNDKVNEFNGNKNSNVTLDDLIKVDPELAAPKKMAVLQSVAGLPPDKAIEGLQKMGETRLAAVLADKFGIDTEKYALKRDQDKKTSELQQKITAVHSDADAQSVLANPTQYSNDVVKAAQTWQKNAHDKEVRLAADKKSAELKATSSSIKNTDGSWNVDSLPVGLVEHNIDPSQLSKRSGDYDLKLEQANAYSREKYGKPFDIAQASTDYKYAQNPTTQNTLKLIAGVAEPNGALEIAENAAKKLPQFDTGLINKVFGSAKTEFGSSDVTDFHTAMLGLADEYGKIMGGGVASDTGRDQALNLLKAAYSKNQLSGAVDIIRQDIAARKAGLVGENPYLLKQFGASSSMKPPQGAVKKAPSTKDGKWYWLDANNKPLGAVR